jgi:Zn-dependent protease
LQQFDFIRAVFEFVILVFSLSVHECAHAWMASRLGDQTARLRAASRSTPCITWTPSAPCSFRADDLRTFIGLSMFGGMLVGWAKPTPVITRNFRKIVRDDNLTTLAGPASNLLLVLVAFLVLAVISIAVPGATSSRWLLSWAASSRACLPAFRRLLMQRAGH